ncbi:MAG: pirin family protein [Spirochaetia bacterium]|nr:pirin family protein [Spirochaetia bacterium]
MSSHKIRNVSRFIQGEETSDGAGVKLKRMIGTSELNFLDPFLLLDEFKNENPDDYIAGFPSHPHRGFETVTYLLAGRMRHRDSNGNEGLLTPGAVQWMTAGKGIIHSEMPEMEDGLIWGYQLWVNLPSSLKMSEPKYQDIPPEEIPVFKSDGIEVVVIAGSCEGVNGAANTSIPIYYLDVKLEKNRTFQMEIPQDMNSLIHMIEGEAWIGTDRVQAKQGDLAVLDSGEFAQIKTDAGARFLLLAARPIEEPVARGGPFVMNTREEIIQAFRDYESGNFA